MGAFTVTQVDQLVNVVGQKRVILRATGPASYDAGGSVIDLSTSNSVLGKENGFTKVYGVRQCGIGASGASIFDAKYIPAAANAPDTGKVFLRDLSAASDAEASGDLHTHTFILEATGT